jgi:hypothetical protein
LDFAKTLPFEFKEVKGRYPRRGKGREGGAIGSRGIEEDRKVDGGSRRRIEGESREGRVDEVEGGLREGEGEG